MSNLSDVALRQLRTERRPRLKDSSQNETKVDAERDLRDLISAAGADVAEKARRERLLRHLESADKAHPLELAKYSLERAGASSSEMDVKR